MNDYIHPEYIEQHSDDSIINAAGLYDMQNISLSERAVVLQVLANVKRKYPKKYRTIGLYNESYPVLYKPRYLLFEILIQKYEKSEHTIEQFAVALAYTTKGANGRAKAIEHLELAMPKITDKDLQHISRYILLWAAFNDFSVLYEKEGYYDLALTYAEATMRLKGFIAPFDVTHTGDILKKIDIQRCVDYYKGLLLNDDYAEYHRLIEEKLQQTEKLQAKGYVYRPRKVKHNTDFDDSVREAAKQFL